MEKSLCKDKPISAKARFLFRKRDLNYIGRMEPLLKVGYSKAWANGLILSGMVLLVLYFYLFSLTGTFKPMPMVALSFLVVSGMMYRSKIYFELYTDRIVVLALIGPARKTYEFASMSDIMFEGERLYIVGGPKRKRIWVGKLMADKQQWAAFVSTIRSSQAGGELHD
jgi:hypothetical protein